MQEPEEPKNLAMREYSGVAASPGIAIGHAFIYNEVSFWVEEESIPMELVPQEQARLRTAVEAVIQDLRALRYKIEVKVGRDEARIFDPHIMFLEDPAVIKETDDIIATGRNAEFAFFRTTRKIVSIYKNLEDSYLRQRGDDITDILRRVHTKLQGKEYAAFSNLKFPVIVVAPNLTPSDTANMHTGNVLAFITDLGGLTSHATILARSLGIPAVLGVKTASADISPGELMIVNGFDGKVIVNPDERILAESRARQAAFELVRLSLKNLRELPAVTTDGHVISLQANIEFPEEALSVSENGATGVGLYRSEYHFLKGNEMPSEDELFADYFKVAELLAPRTVIIRTFDLGGDKMSHLIPAEPEENPFLGWRAIRVSLSLPILFKIHLRAILRASRLGNLKVMFPMISSLDELEQALVCLEEVKTDLRKAGEPFNEHIPVGIMIEIPAAVMIADHLAKRADFFSIGTNDLVQYSVAVDRTNDRIASLFDPFHPGVLRLIHMTAEAGRAHGIPVAVCGELSNDPAAALVLMGLGIDELSMAPSYIPTVKNIIRSVDSTQVTALAQKLLALPTAEAVKHLLREEITRMAPDIAKTIFPV